MARSTEAETTLHELVTERSLQTSLALIPQADEASWSEDAPRVIHDFTDHGLAHSARLAKRAVELLRSPVSGEQ